MSFLAFEPVIERKLFSELFGFVISDLLKLESLHEKPTLGLDLLDLYTTTDEGNRVAMEGAAIPILGVEAGYYSIIFREATTPSLLHEAPVGVSTGWVLEVVSGKVAVCGLAALSKWNPANPSVRHVSVPIGWYGIDVWLGASSINGDDYTLEIVMSRSATKPLFSADVTKNFSEGGS